MALGIGLYLIPLAMVQHPSLIELSTNPGSAIVAFIQIAVGLVAISYAVIARSLGWRRLPLCGLGVNLLFVI